MTKDMASIKDLTVAVIPGGPGLSSGTLSDLAALGENCNVRFLDLPRDHQDWSYNGHVASYEEQLGPIKNLVLCGHSFGGIVAADLACRGRLSLAGLILISAPFSKTAFAAIGECFRNGMTPELDQAGRTFFANPDDQNFRVWLSKYRSLYFPPHSVERGSEMLFKDAVDQRAYFGAGSETHSKDHLLLELAELQVPKIFLAGYDDGLFPVEVANREAIDGNLPFFAIRDAGHFAPFDQPQAVLKVILEFLGEIYQKQSMEGK